jgi:hypothetical protein
MDPYLEAPELWPGLHDRLIVEISNALQPLLLPRYFVEIAERVYLEFPQSYIVPDAAIHRRELAHAGVGVASVQMDEPVILPAAPRTRESYLEIRKIGSNELVTVLEVISPSNKRAGSHGREEYLRKQHPLLESDVNLVEIDLLRDGAPTVCAPLAGLLTLARWDYLVAVSRAKKRWQVETYAVTLRDRLPRVKVPLREPDPDVPLDLPGLFAKTYENSAYSVRLDYRQPPAVPLREADAQWAEELLHEAGCR